MQIKTSAFHKASFSVLSFSALLLCLSPPSMATTSVSLPNPGFEDADPADQTKPAQWRIDGKAVEIGLVKDMKRSGNQALRVQFKEGAPYAGVLQRLDVETVRGKSIDASAWFARGKDEANVGIWIGAFDKDRKRIAYANTYDSAEAKRMEWTKHNMRIDIPNEAASVMLGIAIYGKDGVMWVDDIQATISATVALSATPAPAKTRP
jgi:hypothetical protein